MRDAIVDRIAGSPLERPARLVWNRLRGKTDSATDRRNREYDEMTVVLLRRVLGGGGNAIDAGAHRGVFLREMVRASPKGSHWAFEPIPTLAASLRKRFPMAVVHELALGAEDTEAVFHHLPDKAAQSSLLARPIRERGERVVELTVSVRRLDSLWPEELPLSFVKVDVEGAEVDLFRGGRETLTRWRPTVVFECHPDKLPEAASVLAEAGLRASLLQDAIEGRLRPPQEVQARAVTDGEWYFAAVADG